MTQPMRLVLGDRATSVVSGVRVDVNEIAVETSKAWFQQNLRYLDVDQHLLFQVELKEGSEELTGLFQEQEIILGANDTSVAVGFAPLTETERLVLECERFANSPEFKAHFPETGEDVKVMGVRALEELDLTLAMPFLDRFLVSEDQYFQKKEEVSQVILEHLRTRSRGFENIHLSFNALDQRGKGLAGMYLSVVGTSAEGGDSGQVGRGNDVNGLISLNRPRNSEAAAGKNPINHIGKIYSQLTHELAGRLHQTIPPLEEVMVWLCGRIGEPVSDPFLVSVQVGLERGTELGDVQGPIQKGVEVALADIGTFCQSLVEGGYSVC
jgi:S-adenosylmethionine synthetase